MHIFAKLLVHKNQIYIMLTKTLTFINLHKNIAYNREIVNTLRKTKQLLKKTKENPALLKRELTKNLGQNDFWKGCFRLRAKEETALGQRG